MKPTTETFATIQSIRLDDPSTWQDKVFLTLDMDWASDRAIQATAEILERAGVAATWFVTHDTPVLQRLRANPKFELGIHPNFNQLLQGEEPRNGRSVREVVSRLMAIVPEAVSVRSHSMTQSSRVLDEFGAAGLRFDCNLCIPASTEIFLKPFVHWTGLVRVPYFWEETVHFTYGWSLRMSDLRTRPGLKVFAFHPLHILLNTDNYARYERFRNEAKDESEYERFVNPGFGARSQLLELLGLEA